MDILCSDKTGTLTKNEITVGEIELIESKDKNEVLKMAALASNPESHDVIDEAIYSKLENKDLLKNFTKEKFIPFDPISKKATAYIKTQDGKTFQAVKGAPQVILSMSLADETWKFHNRRRI